MVTEMIASIVHHEERISEDILEKNKEADINGKMNLSGDGSATLMSDGRFGLNGQCFRTLENTCLKKHELGFFPRHRGPSQELNTGKLASAPRSFQAKENSQGAKVLGAQLEGDFHSHQSSKTLGLGTEQQHYVISRQSPKFCLRFMWSLFAFCTSSFAASSDLTQQGLKPKPPKDRRSTSGLGIKRTSPFGRLPCYLWGLGQVPESFRVSAT
ncbi:uncharacterized protein LOC117062866 [Trachypithecus francoisi]|uniref:uncharacterized protein LOC117062866 n=1 Tax=Trachypithecus francoisi TaxID=54180 RepID=UPI00141BEE92|nr:uncharacterized protein LOC117062866 [Trachypithecus francoisi]